MQENDFILNVQIVFLVCQDSNAFRISKSVYLNKALDNRQIWINHVLKHDKELPTNIHNNSIVYK